MKRNGAQYLKDIGQGIKKCVIHGQTQSASSKGDGKGIFMLACVATDREMAEAFLQKVAELQAGLRSQGYTTILQARLPDGGPMERPCSDRPPNDDFVDMTRTSSGDWRFNRGDDYEEQSVSADCSVRVGRSEADIEDGSGSLVQARTRILSFPTGRRTIRKSTSVALPTGSFGPEAA
jgi:hypothetical protein